MNILKKHAEKRLIKKRAEERRCLREDINELEAAIRKNECIFNLTTDEYLLESAIYEHNAQCAKLNYLLKLAKEM